MKSDIKHEIEDLYDDNLFGLGSESEREEIVIFREIFELRKNYEA